MIDGMDQDNNEDVRIMTNIKRRITTRKTRRKVDEKGYDKVQEKNKEKKDEDENRSSSLGHRPHLLVVASPHQDLIESVRNLPV